VADGLVVLVLVAAMKAAMKKRVADEAEAAASSSDSPPPPIFGSAAAAAQRSAATAAAKKPKSKQPSKLAFQPKQSSKASLVQCLLFSSPGSHTDTTEGLKVDAAAAEKAKAAAVDKLDKQYGKRKLAEAKSEARAAEDAKIARSTAERQEKIRTAAEAAQAAMGAADGATDRAADGTAGGAQAEASGGGKTKPAPKTYKHSVTGMDVPMPPLGCLTSKSGKSRQWTEHERALVHDANEKLTIIEGQSRDGKLAAVLRTQHPKYFGPGTPCCPGGIKPQQVGAILKQPVESARLGHGVATASRLYQLLSRRQSSPPLLLSSSQRRPSSLRRSCSQLPLVSSSRVVRARSFAWREGVANSPAHLIGCDLSSRFTSGRRGSRTATRVRFPTTPSRYAGSWCSA
jgi:hypothetical protein